MYEPPIIAILFPHTLWYFKTLPSGNFLHSHWKCSVIVSCPIHFMAIFQFAMWQLTVQVRWFNRWYMAMGQNLWYHIWVDEHPFTSYFDVHQGYRVLTHNHMVGMEWGWNDRPGLELSTGQVFQRRHSEAPVAMILENLMNLILLNSLPSGVIKHG